jgi:MFS family permease
MTTHTLERDELKWPEVLSLAGLNAAVVISWIAYHEYQPVIIEKYNLQSLATFLVVTKAIVLVLIPPVAGWLADIILKKNGKYFTIFSVGIGSTAMIFMVVASILGAGPLSAMKAFLPYMIILWLIAMNLFISPANSMIEAFAPANKLPMVMGVLVLTTELIYALEPLVISLVRFFGDTLTFIVGGVLIAGTGYIFHRVSSDEVIQRKHEMEGTKGNKSYGFIAIITIVVIGACLGLSKAILVEIIPTYLSKGFDVSVGEAQIIAFGLLGFSAILAFVLSKVVEGFGITTMIMVGFVALLLGAAGLFLSPNYTMAFMGAVVVAMGFSLLNITGLPFTLQHLSVRHVTYGVGIYIGASEIFTGLAEYVML